jgi:5,10-methylenetetrahydrofolate reductase
MYISLWKQEQYAVTVGAGSIATSWFTSIALQVVRGNTSDSTVVVHGTSIYLQRVVVEDKQLEQVLVSLCTTSGGSGGGS